MNTYIVVWSGGYEAPAIFASTDYTRALEVFEGYASEAELSGGEMVQLIKFDPARGTTELGVV